MVEKINYGTNKRKYSNISAIKILLDDMCEKYFNANHYTNWEHYSKDNDINKTYD